MKKLLLLTTLLIPSIAFAQDQKKEFDLKVTQEELQIIGKALDERPFKEAAPLIQKLNQQIQTQMRPVAPVPPVQPMQTKPEKSE